MSSPLVYIDFEEPPVDPNSLAQYGISEYEEAGRSSMSVVSASSYGLRGNYAALSQSKQTADQPLTAGYGVFDIAQTESLRFDFMAYLDPIPASTTPYGKNRFLRIRSMGIDVLEVYLQVLPGGYLWRIQDIVNNINYSSQYFSYTGSSIVGSFSFRATPTSLMLYLDDTPIIDAPGTYSFGEFTRIAFGSFWSDCERDGLEGCTNVFDNMAQYDMVGDYVYLTYNSTPIAVDADINGVTTPSGDTVAVQRGSTITASVPQTTSGYDFSQWDDGTQNPTRSVLMDVDKAITANYVLTPIPPHEVLISSEPIAVDFTLNGQTYPSGTTMQVEDGGVINVKFPSEVVVDLTKYTFGYYLLNGEMYGGPQLSIQVNADADLKAIFIPETEAHNVQISSEPIAVGFTLNGLSYPSGSVIPIDHGEIITVEFPSDVDVDMLAYHFNRFIINGDQYGGPKISIKVNADVIMKAVYTTEPTSPDWYEDLKEVIKVTIPAIIGGVIITSRK
jgi:hypothetical protein